MVMLVLVGATAFTGVFSIGGGMTVISDFVLAMPGGTFGALLLMLFLVFILGMFLDWTGIVLLSFPIMLPIIAQMGVDVLWFVVMVAVVLQTSFLTPPFGYALFYLKGVARQGWRSLICMRGGIVCSDHHSGLHPDVYLPQLDYRAT